MALSNGRIRLALPPLAIVKFAMLSLSMLGLAGALRERADRCNGPA